MWLLSAVFNHFLLLRTTGGRQVSETIIDANKITIYAIFGLTMLAYLICIILFIMWFRRAYYNLHQLTKNLSYKESWAAWAWFVPIMHLFRPYQIMKELYEETDVLLTRSKAMPHNLNIGLLKWWWGLWVSAQFLRYIIQEALSKDFLFNFDPVPRSIVNMIYTAFFILLTMLTIRVVKNYAEAEPELIELANKKEEELKEETGLFTESEYRRYLDYPE